MLDRKGEERYKHLYEKYGQDYNLTYKLSMQYSLGKALNEQTKPLP